MFSIDSYRLTGKRAIVCGSTQGIGRACALALANLGASVTLAARNESALKAVLAELPATAGQAHGFIVADFNDPQQVRERVAENIVTAGTAHILVNNSGGPPAGAILAANPADFLAAINRHLICNHLLAQAVIPGMKAAGYGRIINIISTSVREPIPGLGVSNTTRCAVASWAKTLSREVAPFGITVNNILPGATETGRIQDLINNKARSTGQTPEQVRAEMIGHIPAGRFAHPDETAAATAFLASPAASYITGVSLPVDGGRIACI